MRICIKTPMKTYLYIIGSLLLLGQSTLISCAQVDNNKGNKPNDKITVLDNNKGNKPNDKITVGQVAEVYIKEGDINFLGRVDTGAEITSINAQNVKEADGMVEFTMINHDGKEYRLKSKVVKESFVQNAEAREKRYNVYLTLVYENTTKKILVNLNDRKTSTYKILLGRNWLTKNFVVDVDKE